MVGIREIEDQIWLVSFLDHGLGCFENERGRVEPGPNPFVPDKVLPMCRYGQRLTQRKSGRFAQSIDFQRILIVRQTLSSEQVTIQYGRTRKGNS
jgi:hypothetical protein